MNYRVTLSTRAKQDLLDIYTYILSRGGDIVARNFVNAIHEYCSGFQTFPERGARRDDKRQGLRHVGFKRKATIAFMIIGEDVIILRVYRPGRDIDGPDNDTP